uniref:WAP domain-containing protein n=1 Tax=Aquila chrysaetos chrysaetos TaxID=223781 RepID=A0A663EAT2_AQUCH
MNCSHAGTARCALLNGKGHKPPCDRFCSSDEDCPGSERCCSTGCGRECRLPAGGEGVPATPPQLP